MASAGWGLSGWGDPFQIVGNEPFDQLLTGLCAIYRKTGGSKDAYGNYSKVPLLVEDKVLCRLSTPSEGTEFVDPKQVAVRKLKFFMRPREYHLGEYHGIVFESRGFNITSVVERRDANHAVHHLEVFVKEVMPSQISGTSPS